MSTKTRSKRDLQSAHQFAKEIFKKKKQVSKSRQDFIARWNFAQRQIKKVKSTVGRTINLTTKKNSSVNYQVLSVKRVKSYRKRMQIAWRYMKVKLTKFTSCYRWSCYYSLQSSACSSYHTVKKRICSPLWKSETIHACISKSCERYN